MSAPPPKRARQEGSFSPASPPYYEGAKQPPQPKTYSPATPFSPPSMTSTASQNGPDSTMNSSDTKAHHPADTPAGGFTGIPGLTLTSNSTRNDIDTHMTNDALNEVDLEPAPQEPATTVDHTDNRRSDHERKETESAPAEEKPEWESGKLGPYYLLGTEPIKKLKIDSRNDLIEQLGLTNIANSVRRIDPATGEKINKLRKSYEGKVKQLGIAGRNKAVNVEGEFLPNITDIPELEWAPQHSTIDSLEKTFRSDDFFKQMDLAMEVSPGPLDKETDSKYKAILDSTDGPRKGPAEISRKPSGVPPNALVGSQRPSAVPSPASKPMRPERTGTKRRYNDASFDGYTDTFDTEELASEDDGQGGGRGRKRPRKDTELLGLQAYGDLFNVEEEVSEYEG